MDSLISIFQKFTDLFQQLGNIFSQIFSILLTIFNFLVGLLKFIVNSGTSLIKNIYKVFENIFTDGFFDTLNVGFNGLLGIIGGVWLDILIVLLVIVFCLILFGFVLRLMKGQLHYYNTNSGLKTWKKHLGK